MTNNVYKFPGRDAPRELPKRAVEAAQPESKPRIAKGKSVWQSLVLGVWFVVALVWPFLRWIVALDVVFQGLLMVWHWNTPNSHAGWTFLLHFAVLVALTTFVSVFKPKGVK